MNKLRIVVVCLMAMVLVSACAGTVYKKTVNLDGGDTADVVGRTGAFGTDAVAIRFKSKAPNDPNILRLQSFHSRQATIQTYDQKCPLPEQLKNIRTRTENVVESSYQDVPNPNKRQDQIAVIGGTNPSTGNVLLPAAVQAAGMAGGMIGGAAVLRPARVNVQQNGGGATAGGGNATGGSAFQAQGQRQGQGQVSSNTNLNANQNNNNNAANASSAAAAAAAGN